MSAKPGFGRKWFPSISFISAIWLLSITGAESAPDFQQSGNWLVMSNANVQVKYNLAAGTADFYWQNAKKITAFYSAVTNGNGGSFVASTNYPARNWAVVGSTGVVVTNSGGGLPTMLQRFTLGQDDGFLVNVSLSAATNLQSRWMAPLVMNTAGGVDIGVTNDNRALFVPFDNDHFVRYNAESINGSDTGNEVGAFYDNTTRSGLVVGSVTHDQWKTGVYWSGSNNRLDKLCVFGGVTSHWTWDVMPHGLVGGTSISSPVIFVGFGSDWRTTMENFADANVSIIPKLPWTNGVPFGWNSWGYYQSGISYASAIAVSDSLHTNLQPYGFSSSNTVYVNLDSYWDNLSGSQLKSFTAHCHANGQKAGIYCGPFVFWGNANDATNYFVPPDYVYRYSQILLRDGNGNFIANDGALAVDPTHPGAKSLMDYYVNIITNNGFDYVKLDFLSHGSLEGVHYDASVTTGIQAYNQGMQYMFSHLAGKVFISESIAPLFPYQYGHSRRIACDAQNSRISDTEYTMNSVTYGWWLDRLYFCNDPDILDFGTGAAINERQSRVICGAVTGMMLNGDSLTNSASIGAAQQALTNAAINAVARAGRTFAPVEANTGSSANDLFVRQDNTNWLIAAFNYGSGSANKIVDLGRAGLPSGTYKATDLWSGTSATVSGSLSVSLGSKQARLFTLSQISPFAAPSVWLKADAISGMTNHAGVSVWPDSSGNANDATNSSAAQQPMYVTNALNSLPAVRFDSSSSEWLAFPRTVGGDFTLFCVFQSTQGLGSGSEFWSGAGLVNGEVGGSTSDFGVSLNASGQILAGVGDGGTAVSTGGFNDGAPHLLTFKRVQTSGAVTLYVDGVPASATSGNTTSLTSPPRLVLGAQQTMNSFLTGDIAEVKIFSSALSDLERLAEESSLLVKYGIGGAQPVGFLAISSLGVSGSDLVLSGTNQGVGIVCLLASSNLALPFSQWHPVATNVLVGSGSFSLTASNAVDPNLPQQFYILSSSNPATL